MWAVGVSLVLLLMVGVLAVILSVGLRFVYKVVCFGIRLCFGLLGDCAWLFVCYVLNWFALCN